MAKRRGKGKRKSTKCPEPFNTLLDLLAGAIMNVIASRMERKYHFQDAKYMKVRLKDKISQYVDFTYGYGSEATLGFKRQKDSSFPITLIPRKIDDFPEGIKKLIE